MLSHEEVNLHVEENYEVAHKAATNNNLQGVWPVAKPILQLISSFPLIPVKWRNVLQGLIFTIDAIVNKPEA